MPVTCANCGEELLGAVNRCWRCGQTALSAPGSGDAPPIRQAPAMIITAEAVPLAMIVIDETGAASEGTESPIATPAENAPPPTLPASTAPQQFGLPPPRPAVYEQRGLVDVAAVASIVLGALALLLGVFFSWSLLLGFVGLGAGLWGFRSRWRQMAVIGLLLSLMGIAGSSARLAYDSFTWWYGQSPLGPSAGPGTESTLPDSLE